MQVQTKYVIVLNDDLQWDKKIIHHFIHVMQLHPHLDLVGGQAGDFSGLLHLKNDTLYMTKVIHILFISYKLFSFHIYVNSYKVGKQGNIRRNSVTNHDAQRSKDQLSWACIFWYGSPLCSLWFCSSFLSCSHWQLAQIAMG